MHKYVSLSTNNSIHIFNFIHITKSSQKQTFPILWVRLNQRPVLLFRNKIRYVKALKYTRAVSPTEYYAFNGLLLHQESDLKILFLSSNAPSFLHGREVQHNREPHSDISNLNAKLNCLQESSSNTHLVSN